LRLGVAKRGEKTRSVPGGAGGDLLALEEHQVRPPELREMIGDGTPGDPSTDDDRAGMAREGLLGHRACSLRCPAAFVNADLRGAIRCCDPDGRVPARGARTCP